MKSLIDLTRVVITECGKALCTSTIRDINTVTERFNTEGESFLTITLPNFAKAFETALDRGWILTTDFPAFKKTGRSGRLPAFLQGFVGLVFDRSSGRLLDGVSTEAIFCIRQICLMHGKLHLQANVKRTKDAILNYIKCEKEVEESASRPKGELHLSFERISTLLYRDVLSDMDRIIYDLDHNLVPRFGPGATAEKLSANQRWRSSSWTTRLQEVFPSEYFRIPNERHSSFLEEIHFFEPGAEPPVRVITVPKTQKTPRIIAIEPAHNMFMQQALMRLLVSRLENDSLLGGMIGFTDQKPNQELAKAGSVDRSLATLDLSEASDRVSVQHVEMLTHRFSLTKRAIMSCRSLRADVPGHGIHTLAKFASMGSALTFPLEAMTFLTSIFVAYELKLKRPITRMDIKSISSSVRVYGDDLIVPVDIVHYVKLVLESLGFKINEHKSFWNGRFRESCGKEYYDGTDVSVVKFRRRFPKSRRNAEEVQALVSFRNQMYWAGMWQTCKWLDEEINHLFDGYFPIVEPTSPCLGRESVLPYTEEKQHPRYQHAQVKAWKAVSKAPIDNLDGVPALLKSLTLLAERYDDRDSKNLDHLIPYASDNHLERSGRPKSTFIKLGWCSPF